MTEVTYLIEDMQDGVKLSQQLIEAMNKANDDRVGIIKAAKANLESVISGLQALLLLKAVARQTFTEEEINTYLLEFEHETV